MIRGIDKNVLYNDNKLHVSVLVDWQHPVKVNRNINALRRCPTTIRRYILPYIPLFLTRMEKKQNLQKNIAMPLI